MKMILVIISIIFALFNPADAEEIDCTACHPDLLEGKSVHAAVRMGCPSCHSGVNAKDVPHKFATLPKGLTSDQPELCYGCHERTAFFGPAVHAPVGVGTCTSCHNPHRADNEKLLVKAPTELCFDCHDRAGFKKKASGHKPVEAGECTECHGPHASQNDLLLKNKGNMLCRKCHPEVIKQPHAVSGFKRAGHPLSGRKDPLRTGKTFECLSCHVAHTSDWPKLYRYKAQTPFELCTHCHEL